MNLRSIFIILFFLLFSQLKGSPLHFLDSLPDWINIFEILTPEKAAIEIQQELKAPVFNTQGTTGQGAANPGASFTRTVRRDKSGRVIEVILQNETSEILGKLKITWHQPKYPTSLMLYNSQGEMELTHAFEYDQQGQIKRHIKSHNGIQEVEECSYAKDGSLSAISDSRGRRIQFIPAQRSGLQMALTRSAEGYTLRSLWIENKQGELIWSAVDDGNSEDPNNLQGISQRTWKKISHSKTSSSIEEGYTLSSGQEVLVRTTVANRDKRSTQIYGEHQTLLFQSEEPSATTQLPIKPQGGVEKKINGLGQVESIGDEKITYNLFGFPNRIQTKDGAEAVIETNLKGELQKLTRPDGTRFSCTFSPDGLPQEIVEGGQKAIESSFDSFGRPTKILAYHENATVPEEIQIEYSTFHKKRAIYSTGKLVEWSYDHMGRVATIDERTVEGTATWNLSYDAIDRITRMEQIKTNSNGKKLHREIIRTFDLQSRLSKEEISMYEKNSPQPPKKCIKTWNYTKENTILQAHTDDATYTAIINPKGQIIEEQFQSATHAPIFLKHAYIQANNAQVHMTQRPDGVRRKRISSNDGKKLEEFYFDAQQQLVREIIRETRDEMGSGELIERGFGKHPMSRRVVWNFGPDRRLRSFGVGGIDEPIMYTNYFYTNDGLMQKKVLPDGISTEYTYDAKHRLIEVKSSDRTIHYTISYDAMGRISSTQDLVHNAVVERGFNSEGSLSFERENDLTVTLNRATDKHPEHLDICAQAQITYTDEIWATWKDLHKRFERCREPLRSSGTAIDPLLQPAQIKENGTTYTFDLLGQLEKEESEFGTSLQRFSPLGTLTEREGVQVEHDSQGRPKIIGGEEYDYDVRGNLRLVKQNGVETTLHYDAFDRLMHISSGKMKESYRYDYFARKREKIVFIDDQLSLSDTLRYLWLGHEEIGSVDGHATLQDFKVLDLAKDTLPSMVGFFKQGQFYETSINLQGTPLEIKGVGPLHYTAFGHSIIGQNEVVSPWGFMGKRSIDPLNGWDFGGRVYMPALRSFISQDPFWLFGTGASPYSLLQNHPVQQIEIFGLFSWPATFGDFLSYMWKGVETVFWKSYTSITFAKKQLDWFYEFRSHFEDFAFRIVSRGYLNLIGYNPDGSSYGTFGNRELAPKVRITEINGILNAFDDIFEHIQVISDSHGGMPIHYIYSATEGFTGDLLRSAFAKIGFISPQAKYLAATWKRLIKEMGGINGGGIILHYAHSLGGTDTQAALSLLTAAERKLILVSTFGAATLVADSNCRSVMNYVSIADGVPFTCAFGYIQALLGWREDVCFLESKSPLPLIDHLFLGESYRRVIEELGRKFQEEYLRKE